MKSAVDSCASLIVVCNCIPEGSATKSVNASSSPIVDCKLNEPNSTEYPTFHAPLPHSSLPQPTLISASTSTPGVVV